MADEPMREERQSGDAQSVDADSGGTKNSGAGGGLGLLLGVFVGGVIFDSVTFALIFGMAGLIIGGSTGTGGSSEEQASDG